MSTQLSLKLDNMPQLREQFRGAFVGAAVGDALGFITEFMRSPDVLRDELGVEKLTRLIPWERRTRYEGKYLIKLPLSTGTYSDDTQLTLATARAIKSDGAFDIVSFSKIELPLWLHYQLGGGTGTLIASRELGKKGMAWHTNFYETQ